MKNDHNKNENVKQISWEAKFMNKKHRHSLIERLANYRQDVIDDTISNEISAMCENMPPEIPETPEVFSDIPLNSAAKSNKFWSYIHSNEENDNMTIDTVSELSEKSSRNSISFCSLEDTKKYVRRHSIVSSTHREFKKPVLDNPSDDTLRRGGLSKTYHGNELFKSGIPQHPKPIKGVLHNIQRRYSSEKISTLRKLTDQSNGDESLERNEEMLLQLY